MKQTSIAGKTTGSFVNYMMGNNSTVPEVGKGCTLLSWTDRDAYEVMSVSEDLKRVVIQQYHADRIDNNGMSESQKYKFEKLNGIDEVIVWKWGAWRKEMKQIQFTESFSKTIGPGFYQSEEYKEIYKDREIQLIEGKTQIRVSYSKVNILWGTKQQYYDYSF